ncbi:tyrosine-type recombinase/integrase [Amycolatopsis sp. NPDC005232]|uniref:tyrosine-type recombinase/integrase n=1 Tax=Amycolatopsis sp. NPDC005232 TaxID=3157027 RepID=UPI0033A1D943
MANVSRRPNGKWRARYRDEAGNEHARHFDRKIDGQRWLDEVTASVVTGQYVDPGAGRITLAQYFAQWSAQQVWVDGTEKAMSLAVRSSTFKNLELRKIRPTHVERWVKIMRDGDPAKENSRKLAPGTIHTRVSNVRAVLRAAVRDKLISSDPAENVALPRLRKAEAAMTLPSSEEVGALIAAANDTFGVFVALCAFAGLRLGEAAAVQVRDIDFLRKQLTVARQVQRAGGKKVDIRLPKYGSERVVFLPQALLDTLSAHIAKLDGAGRERWLFLGEEGNPPHQNTVTYWWGKTRKAADVSGVKLHDLRHYFASGLIASGCDVVTVQRALGHSKATTTLNTYAHLWPSAEDRTRQAAADLMTQALSAADSVRTKEAK